MSSSEKPTSIRLDPEILRFVKQEAERRRWSVSTMLREIINHWVLHTRMQREKKK